MDVSRERLNQIADRRLTKLGLRAGVGSGEALEGTLPFASITVSGHKLTGARFVVVSHDQLRFIDPPLHTLAPIPFYDVQAVAELEARVLAALERRGRALQQLNARFKELRLVPTMDHERLVLMATAKMPTVMVAIDGTEELGVPVTRITAVHQAGKTFMVAPAEGALDLSVHASAIDFELYLNSLVPTLLASATEAPPEGAKEAAPPAPPPTTTKGGGPLKPVAVAGDAPPLAWLLSRFGPQAVVPRVEIVQDYKDDVNTYRVVATHVQGASMKVVVYSSADPQRPVFADTLDFARAPPLDELVATVLGRPSVAPAKPAAPDASAEGARPRVGEVWVMVVVIEREDGDEVRYAMVNPDGTPYGAARILKRADFRAVFQEVGGAWRLPVTIDEIVGDELVYRQLDSDRMPSGPERRLSIANFMSSFQPEASLYA